MNVHEGGSFLLTGSWLTRRPTFKPGALGNESCTRRPSPTSSPPLEASLHMTVLERNEAPDVQSTQTGRKTRAVSFTTRTARPPHVLLTSPLHTGLSELDSSFCPLTLMCFCLLFLNVPVTASLMSTVTEGEPRSRRMWSCFRRFSFY